MVSQLSWANVVSNLLEFFASTPGRKVQPFPPDPGNFSDEICFKPKKRSPWFFPMKWTILRDHSQLWCVPLTVKTSTIPCSDMVHNFTMWIKHIIQSCSHHANTTQTCIPNPAQTQLTWALPQSPLCFLTLQQHVKKDASHSALGIWNEPSHPPPQTGALRMTFKLANRISMTHIHCTSKSSAIRRPKWVVPKKGGLSWEQQLGQFRTPKSFAEWMVVYITLMKKAQSLLTASKSVNCF